LQDTDVVSREEGVKEILHDVEYRVNRFKKECGVEYNRIEAGYYKRVGPVENLIIDHPIPAVMAAAGIGSPSARSSVSHATDGGSYHLLE